ncbi:MAG: tetratricopeptide repeat protein [Chloracidobacterium sp.]|uniref:Tetratricopeptide repeat protein n=1 Tax=Chloracidobacterium validum TaxID=2821543 RepID=A0ABX8B9P1_9BACT|nr:tetratricopeptide repeat protein [Chloracidobacterium validum]QUW02766.1 tetratricopeptide repeat protein [Chloracidobacterium validum]
MWFVQHKRKATCRSWWYARWWSSRLWAHLGLLGLGCLLSVGAISAQEGARRFMEDEEAQARLQRGISLYQQEQYATALETLEPVAVHYPEQAVAYRMIGLCRLQMKQYAAAAAALRKASELTRAQENREDAVARLALGKALFLAGDSRGAIPELEFAAARPEADTATLTLLGYAHYRQGDEAAARKVLVQSVARDDRQPEAWRLLAELDVARLTANPDDPAAAKQAAASIEKVNRTEPSLAAGLRGRLLVAQRQFAKAIPELDRALATQPDQAALVFALGLALSREKQLDRAAVLLTKATELLPDEAGVWRELGYVHERAGRREAAIAAYEKAAALTQGHDDFITRALERLKSS